MHFCRQVLRNLCLNPPFGIALPILLIVRCSFRPLLHFGIATDDRLPSAFYDSLALLIEGQEGDGRGKKIFHLSSNECARFVGSIPRFVIPPGGSGSNHCQKLNTNLFIRIIMALPVNKKSTREYGDVFREFKIKIVILNYKSVGRDDVFVRPSLSSPPFI